MCIGVAIFEKAQQKSVLLPFNLFHPKRADAPTQVLKVGGSEGLDFHHGAHREVIVRILDAWLADIEAKAQ